jgi:phage shock protein PspC (stress-responsive transcriptional regulator)
MQNLEEVKVLTRGQSIVFGGVCSGLADYFNLNKNGLRLAFIFLSLFLAVPIILYIVLWLILPKYPISRAAMERHLRREALKKNEE